MKANYTYIFAGTAGESGGELHVIDATAPQSASVVDSIALGPDFDFSIKSGIVGEGKKIQVVDTFAYIVGDKKTGVIKLNDATKPSTLELAGHFSHQSHTAGLHVDGNTIFVAEFSNGLRILSMTCP